jgi:hypothetical protein
MRGMTDHPRYHGDPESDRQTVRPPGVRRLSRGAILVIALIVAAFVLMIVLHITGAAPHQ